MARRLGIQRRQSVSGGTRSRWTAGRIRAAEKVYWMLISREVAVTTASDEQGRETVYDYIGQDRGWLAPVGRLDKASEGLLLLTNDSEWAAARA